MRRFDPAAARCRATALALAGAAAACGAQAQDEVQSLGRVEIVGSRIPRIDAEPGLPVQIITRREIEASGAQTAEELLGRLSANIIANVSALSVGDGSRPGFAGVSLRGLGSTATLVLVNGRRLANYAFSFRAVGVDLHAIPLAAVERVEILKDGASALYGTDAIGGVINFVLRNDFQGAELALYRGLAEAPGGGQARQTASFGWGDPAKDRANVFLIVDHTTDGSLAARERSFSATSYRPADGLNVASNRSLPGNIPIGGGRYANPAAPACTDVSVFARGGCFYDYPRQIDDLPRTEQASIFVRGTWQIAEDRQLFTELMHAQQRMILRTAATPVDFASSNGVVQIDVPTTSPFYPQGLGLNGDISDVHYRTVSLGPRTTEVKADNDRVLAGIKGNTSGWDVDAAAALAASHARYDYVSGIVDANALESVFATGTIDPFGDPSPAAQGLLASTQLHGLARRAAGFARTLDAHASRDIAALPAGPLALAVGVEWRGESLEDIAMPISANVAGGGTNPPKSGSRRVEAAFVELDVPVVQGLGLQLAARDDHYSDFGNTLNPKAALRLQPLRGLLLRSSWGRGFRAPSLPELDTAQATNVGVMTNLTDPVRCPITHLDSDCFPVFKNRFGGNPVLRPVTSTQMSSGIVVEPVRDLSFSVDYWRIRLRNDIGSLDPDTILANAPAYEGRYIIRGPVDPAFPNLPGPIVEIDTLNQNLGRTETAGIDVGARWRSAPAAWGRVSAHVDGTYITQWRAQLADPNFVDMAGANVGGAVVPRWRHDASIGWERGPWTITFDERFQSGYRDANPDGNGQPRRVASYSLCDAQVVYAASKTVGVTIGIRNVFDRDPPFTNQSNSLQLGYDPSYADPRGRFWYVTLKAAFH